MQRCDSLFTPQKNSKHLPEKRRRVVHFASNLSQPQGPCNKGFGVYNFSQSTVLYSAAPHPVEPNLP